MPEYEDLSLTPRAYLKKQGIVACAHDSNAEQSNQPTQGVPSKKIRWKQLEK